MEIDTPLPLLVFHLLLFHLSSSPLLLFPPLLFPFFSSPSPVPPSISLLFLGSGSVGDNDLWHRHIGDFSLLFFRFRPPLESLPAGSKGIPAGSKGLPVGSDSLQAAYQGLSAGPIALLAGSKSWLQVALRSS